MPTINGGQMDSLKRDQLERNVLDHMTRFFGSFVSEAGTDKSKETVKASIDKAYAHGIDAPIDVCTYTELVFTLGLDFEKQIPWAAEILKGSGEITEKLIRWHERAFYTEEE